MRRMSTSLLGAAGWAALLGLSATLLRAEGGPRIPTFSAGIEVVSLSVAVTDARGGQVPDLGAEDLAVFEDGVAQEICLFAQEEWPIRLSILLDNSGSMSAALPVAQAAAIRLLHTLRKDDQAQVAQFSRHLAVLQDFTSDRDALERAVGRIESGGDTALYTALYITLKDLARQARGDEPARRAVIVLSDGEDTASMIDDEQILDLARRAGVVVYTIGLLKANAVGGGPKDTLPTYILTALARETGGRAHFPSTLAELDGAYDRIAEELRTLYGVGYVSRNPRADGQWRRIAIRTRQGSLLVRHRSGYYAPSPDRRSRLEIPATGRR